MDQSLTHAGRGRVVDLPRTYVPSTSLRAGSGLSYAALSGLVLVGILLKWFSFLFPILGILLGWRILVDPTFWIRDHISISREWLRKPLRTGSSEGVFVSASFYIGVMTMRLMRGASVESGVVRVLFGVGAKGRSGRPSSSQSKATPTATSADRSVRATCPQVTQKRLGERAEAAFLAKVAGLGFGVAKPWGDSDRYDFIVDAGGRLWRGQGKSAHRGGKHGEYHFRMSDKSFQTYEENEIDALVCYVAPIDAWYVFPPEVFRGRRSMTLFCTSVRRLSKFEKYREGWWLLEGSSAAKAATLGRG